MDIMIYNHHYQLSLLINHCFTGWWLGHPSEKYDFVNWDDESNPTEWEKKIDGNQTTNQCSIEYSTVFVFMGQPPKLGTFENQGCTCDSLHDPPRKIILTHLTTIIQTPTGISFARGTGWLWRSFWRNGWWNLCNPHIMWSDCSWTKQSWSSRRLWTSVSINSICGFKGTSMVQ